MIEQIDVVGKGSFGCEGPDLPVLDSAEDGAETRVGGARLGPRPRLLPPAFLASAGGRLLGPGGFRLGRQTLSLILSWFLLRVYRGQV